MKRWWMALMLTLGLLGAGLQASADEVMDQIRQLQRAWAHVNYELPDNQKEQAFKELVARAEKLRKQYPDRAEPKIWEAIIRAGYAGAMGGLSAMFNAMPQMKQGRDLLLEAEKIDPKALHGSIYTTLGSFYYMVPGGFIGFGDKKKALEYLKKALEIAPDDLDANYFMGDYWFDQKQYAKAKPYFEKVLALPDVADRPVYSKGRKDEARKRLEAIAKKLRH